MATRYETILANFAYNAGMTPLQTVALPAMVEKCAKATDMTKMQFALLIADDTRTEVSQYVVSLCSRPEIEAISREALT